MTKKNITITVEIELSAESYAHLENIENRSDLLKREVEKKIYKWILDDIGPSKCHDCGSISGHSQQCRIK